MAEFKKKALETLDDIFNLVESEFENYEVDYEDENLRIDSLEGGGTFIISIHSPTSQIWLSSPISGAHHFESKSTESAEWISTRDTSISLKQLIIEELNAE